jgi:hypothetical protein
MKLNYILTIKKQIVGKVLLKLPQLLQHGNIVLLNAMETAPEIVMRRVLHKVAFIA